MKIPHTVRLQLSATLNIDPKETYPNWSVESGTAPLPKGSSAIGRMRLILFPKIITTPPAPQRDARVDAPLASEEDAPPRAACADAKAIFILGLDPPPLTSNTFDKAKFGLGRDMDMFPFPILSYPRERGSLVERRTERQLFVVWGLRENPQARLDIVPTMASHKLEEMCIMIW